MKKFDNLDSLFTHIQKDIQDTLNNEVAREVKETMSESVKSSVYDVYDPISYSRRFGKGGLMCKDNMKHIVKGDKLTVTNETPLDNQRTDYSLTGIIVYGKGRQPFPRDFIGDTKKRLEITGNHKEALKQGLKGKGYEVK